MRLLLDIHISVAVAAGLQRHGIDAISLRDWRGGELADAPDSEILKAAQPEGRVLVTFDLRTIPTLTQDLGRKGESHSGVVLIDDATIQPHDVGGLIRLIRAFVKAEDWRVWTDHVDYMRRYRDD